MTAAQPDPVDMLLSDRAVASRAASETPEQAARRLAASAIAKGFKFVALYEYARANGTPDYWRIRCEKATGAKWIRPMHLNGHGFRFGEPKAPATGRLLYRMPELLAKPDEAVWIVEGESCADALRAAGRLATTSGSASSARGADWTPLKGHPCVIWPDNDKPGQKYGESVAEKLLALSCSVSVVDTQALGLPPKGDCVDWFSAHSGADLATVPIRACKSVGDFGDSGDTTPRVALARPRSELVVGDHGDTPQSGTKDVPPNGVEWIGPRRSAEGTPLPYFAFVERAVSGYPGPGVYYIGQAIEGTKKEVVGHLPPQWLCSPLRVVASTRDAEQSEWGRLLVFTDLDAHTHRWPMPFELLAGDGSELRATLLREGVRITSNRALRSRLETYLQQVPPRIKARCVSCTGWHGNAFALPRETYGDSDAEPVLLQGANLGAVALGKSGTLAEWRELVAAACAGNSRLVLALSMAFAAPCLGLLQCEGGGVHLRGPSSGGKSTALHLAASVYGPPDGYGQTWRATDNGLEGAASVHSDLLLVLDELGQLEPKHAGQVAYLLANGQGKARSRRDGSPRAVARWRVLFLSAGEIGLGDLVTQNGGQVHAGQEVRVIDLPADASAGFGLFDRVPDGVSPSAFADKLKVSVAKLHGTALPVFLKALTANQDKHRETLQALRAEVSAQLAVSDSSGQVRRVADRFALIAAAGELATALDLTGWATGEATNAARACFAAWLAARGTSGDAEPAAMLAQVRGFLEANGEARFTPWIADDRTPRTINRAGYRRDGDSGPTYYVETEAFRKEVCKGFDHRAVARVLTEKKALEVGGDGRPTRKSRLPDGRSARVYVVTPALWEDA